MKITVETSLAQLGAILRAVNKDSQMSDKDKNEITENIQHYAYQALREISYNPQLYKQWLREYGLTDCKGRDFNEINDK